MNGKWKGRRGSWNAGKGISLGDVWEFGRANAATNELHQIAQIQERSLRSFSPRLDGHSLSLPLDGMIE